jgi:hypothetical protein
VKRILPFLLLGLLGCRDEMGAASGAVLRVSPSTITFWDTLPRADPYVETLTITSQGDAPLRIQSLVITGDSAFRLGGTGVSGLTLRPRQEASFTVFFQASDSNVHRGEIWIESNDHRIANLRVPLRNVPALPHIQVTACTRGSSASTCLPSEEPRLLRFGDIPRDGCRRAEILVENLGSAPLRVEPPVLRTGSAPDFEIAGDSTAAFSLNAVDPHGTIDSRVVGIQYCQTLTPAPTGTLVLRSSDPNEPEVLVGIIGPSFAASPPSCTCEPSTLEVQPLDTVTLSGAGCAETPLLYRWTVEQRPPGSTAEIQDATSRDALFFVDFGTPDGTPYLLRVTATNPFTGSASCTYKVFAFPCCPGFHVQLTRDRPVAAVDLELAGPRGTCSAANPTPDWGLPGDGSDDPRCSASNAVYFHPSDGVYRLGVRYACGSGLGAVSATVRIYCNGLEVAAFGPRSLAMSGEFWTAAALEWPGCVATAIDEVSTVPASCGGP